jgi:hypothetical protein
MRQVKQPQPIAEATASHAQADSRTEPKQS